LLRMRFPRIFLRVPRLIVRRWLSRVAASRASAHRTARRVTPTTGLAMPDDFPARPYEAIHKALQPQRESVPDAWREFAFGWNALSYRFAAVADHDEVFTASIRNDGFAPEPPARYRQEDALFNFFAAGLSTLETFAYGTRAIAWAMGNSGFALQTEQQRRQVSPRRLRDQIRHDSKGKQLAAALDNVLSSAEFDEWSKVRNALAHRVAFPRTHTTDPAPTSVPWGDLTLDDQTTARKRGWLAATLSDLLSEAEQFTLAHVTANP
jgi:hypothetical protein